MSTSTTRRILTATTATLVLTGLTTGAAAALPDPGPPPASLSFSKHQQCLLERVGQQYTRCDNLTGNGVPAPTWIPER